MVFCTLLIWWLLNLTDEFDISASSAGDIPAKLGKCWSYIDMTVARCLASPAVGGLVVGVVLYKCKRKSQLGYSKFNLPCSG